MRTRLLAASLFLLASSALATPAFADVKAGVDAWQRGDYRLAVEEWRGPAVAGDADAQFNLGQAYKLGRGVPVDPQMAESWFRKAALQGHEQAADNYGLALFQSGRKQEAVKWLEQSVARDEPRAELVYGTMLFNGDAVARDYPRAYALMTRAAAPRPSVNGQPGTDGLQSARETLAQMDPFVTGPDRERGTALAQQIAITAKNRPAPAPGPMRVTEQSPVRTADAPPPGAVQPPPVTSRRAPRMAGVPTSPPATPRTAEPTTTRSGGVTTTRYPNGDLRVSVAHPRVAPPAPARAAPPKPAAAVRGNWKVQLGAFRDRGNAQALWSRVGGKTGGTAAYVATGGLTRLQATGFASRADAQAACRKAGVACAVIAP